MTVRAVDGRGSFRHVAVFYRSPQEYLDHLVSYIVDGVAAGLPVLVAVPEPNLSRVREALVDATGTSAPVTLADLSRVGRNPGHILGGVLGTFSAQHPPGRARMVCEPVWNGRSKMEYPACVQHEALTNQAFTDRDITVLCPYDATHLDSDILVDAEVTHPCLRDAGHPERISPGFAPAAAWTRYNEPLSTNPTAATYTLQRFTDLAGARTLCAKYAHWFGYASEDVADLQLIVNELASHSLQHGRGPCTLLLWEGGGQLVCQVRDAGPLEDPLAGHRPIDHDGPAGQDGHGLFVVNATADLVRIHSTSAGTTVQAHLRKKAAIR